ncbi:MAG TPA: GNAT family N-acetyltransferase [Solirubrobacterales bacterium]|nr:GNAT family N-acetyltransferase [Solirubrobacterales bacterium]
MTSIETERLLLRPVRPDDLDELVRLHEDPAVAHFIGTPDRDWLAERIGWSRQEWSERGHGLLAIVDRGSGGFLGRTGLKYWPRFDETELGWVLQPEARGRGIATEAAAATLEWARERFEFPYVTAMIRPCNEPSIAVAERLGFSPLREDELDGIGVTIYSVKPG